MTIAAMARTWPLVIVPASQAASVNGIALSLRAKITVACASPGDRPAVRSRNCLVESALDS